MHKICILLLCVLRTVLHGTNSCQFKFNRDWEERRFNLELAWLSIKVSKQSSSHHKTWNIVLLESSP